LQEQESEAVTGLLSKIDDAIITMDGKKAALFALKTITNRYIDEMSALVLAPIPGNQTRVSPVNVRWNIWQISTPISNARMNHGNFTPTSMLNTLFLDEGEADLRRQRMERNFNRLNNFRINQLLPLLNRLDANVEAMREIRRTYLSPFENLDDSFRRELNEIYREHTSRSDRRGNGWDLFTRVAEAFVKALLIAAIIAVAIVLAPKLLVAGVVAGLIIAGAVLVSVPEESVPEWLSGARAVAEGVEQTARNTIDYGPIAIVEAIGQGVMDQVQTPEGIASMAGTVAGLATGKSLVKLVKPPTVPKASVITDGSHHINGKLKANITYKAGEHGYIYKTNSNGVITSASTNNLKLKSHSGRLRHNPNTPGLEQ